MLAKKQLDKLYAPFIDPPFVRAIKLIIKGLVSVILGAFVLATILLPFFLLYPVFTHLIEMAIQETK
jgi:hypothetical protein